MGVIVQRQVDSAISGVLFTEAPGNARAMTIEYCAGAGEALVSGQVNPGRIAVGRDTGNWVKEAAPDEPFAAETLFVNDARVRSLAGRALEIERTFGHPQDVEWTMDGDGRIWIVQARPITVAASCPQRAAVVGGVRQVAWSNANVNENFPEPISPLLYSIARTGYYHYFRNLGRAFGFSRRRLAAMEDPLRQIIGVQGARMYYNLTSIHGVLRSAPFGDQLASWFNQFTGAEETAAPARPTGSAVRARRFVAQSWELALVVLWAIWQYAFVTRRVERFERTVDAFAARTHPARLEGGSRRALLDDLRAFRDIRNNRWKNASLADAAAMVSYGALKRSLGRAFPAADQAALHNSLLKALPNLPSGMPAVKLWELSRLVRGDLRLLDLVGTMPPAEAIATLRRDPRHRRVRRRLRSIPRGLGIPPLRRADAHGSELPGRAGSAPRRSSRPSSAWRAGLQRITCTHSVATGFGRPTASPPPCAGVRSFAGFRCSTSGISCRCCCDGRSARFSCANEPA